MQGDTRVRVAVVQAAPAAFDLEATLERVADHLQRAASDGATLVVFPEAFVGGYPKGADFGARVGTRSDAGRDWFRRYHAAAIESDGTASRHIGALAKRHATHVVLGAIERDGGTLYCSALFYAPDGKLIGKHRKLVPTGIERLIWGSGDGSTLTVCDTAAGRVGAAICWENYMPLFRTSLYAKGVQLYCAPTVDDRKSWVPSMRHIAIEGRCFVLSACQFAQRHDFPDDFPTSFGDDPSRVLIGGGSCIVDPFGEILAGPAYGEETLLVADLELADTVRGKFDLDATGHYARPDVFRLSVDETPRGVAFESTDRRIDDALRDRVRACFPGLRASEDILLDNAGGSQVPAVVADAIRDYMLESYVQLGADYRTSQASTGLVARAHDFLKTFVGARDTGEVVIGPSSSALCAMIADCYGRAFDSQRDEIIVCEAGHAANMAPWSRLARHGYKVRTWHIDPTSTTIDLRDLQAMLGERTRLVAVQHVSNLLGRIEDVPAICELAHAVGARVIADGVAYAPHRAIDVAAWDVDWYVYSTYKVFGPHAAVLFGKHAAFAELEGPNFDFIGRDEVPYKFELGGASHEACAGILALWSYLCFLAGRSPDGDPERATIEHAFDVIARLERPLQDRLLDYLDGIPSVRIIGPGKDSRVATISFTHEHRSSREIATTVNANGIGIRYGHFYAHDLASALGLDPEDGVVRTSFCHYNDEAELDRLLEQFDRLFQPSA